MLRIRHGQRQDSERAFAAHMEDFTTRHQQLQVRTGGQQIHQQRSGYHDLLKVVEHEQQVLLPQHRLQLLPRRLRAALLQSEGLYESGQD